MPNRFNQQRYSLLNVDYVELSSNWQYANIISPYIRIYYINGGSGYLSDATGKVILEEGYLYLIPSFTMITMACDTTLAQYYVQFFDDEGIGYSMLQDIKSIQKVPASVLDHHLFNRLLKINPDRGIRKSYDPKSYEYEAFYTDCKQLNYKQHPAVFHETQGILQQLSSRFLNKQTESRIHYNHHSKKMVETVNYILDNLNLVLSVSHLAQRINHDSDYFSRQFKQHTGMRPINFVNQKRVERAQYLMATTALNYSQIATQIGFDNLSYFSKMFKRFTGLAPGTYKKQMYPPH
ncbi:AraC family transcriptional regulator [Pedobacter sp. Leaf132]|uniref:helix-turn-helix domain-containing protein n=1 Tax=Pedobacter sp. Leaf132 TaxID=2876557 RepID=UPI001E62F3A9|nr:AraC family transcriptional regulator [Pedobacter sp. Leaf132]